VEGSVNDQLEMFHNGHSRHLPTNRGSQFDQRAHERITSRKPIASTNAKAITAKKTDRTCVSELVLQSRRACLQWRRAERRLTLESCYRHSVEMLWSDAGCTRIVIWTTGVVDLSLLFLWTAMLLTARPSLDVDAKIESGRSRVHKAVIERHLIIWQPHQADNMTVRLTTATNAAPSPADPNALMLSQLLVCLFHLVILVSLASGDPESRLRRLLQSITRSYTISGHHPVLVPIEDGESRLGKHGNLCLLRKIFMSLVLRRLRAARYHEPWSLLESELTKAMSDKGANSVHDKQFNKVYYRWKLS
jgi:hypothetical protein